MDNVSHCDVLYWLVLLWNIKQSKYPYMPHKRQHVNVQTCFSDQGKKYFFFTEAPSHPNLFIRIQAEYVLRNVNNT